MTKNFFINNILFVFIGMCVTTSTFATNTDSGRDLHMGAVAMDIPVEMVKRLTPLSKYLSTKLGIPVNFHAAPNLGSAIEDLGSNTTQIAYLTPAAYLEAHEKYGVIPLVMPLNKGKATFSLVIVVPKNSSIQNITDLRGKKFAFGDKKAVVQPAIVEAAGIKLHELATHEHLNHYDNIAKAVINGDFDAGIVKDSTAEQFASQGLRVIYTSEPLPTYVFAVNKNLPPFTLNKIKKSLLALKANAAEGKSILNALENGYDGFAVASDKDFDGVRKLLATP